MSEQEFLEKYGSETVYFSSVYKKRATYNNTELGIWCSGVLEYRDEIGREETVLSIFQLEDFQFGTNR